MTRHHTLTALAACAALAAGCGDGDGDEAAAPQPKAQKINLAERHAQLEKDGRSIYWAITELCKGRPGSYEPAEQAITAVRNGELRADLGTP